MSEIANQLSSETGLSSDLVHKGLGALLNFVKEQLGPETFAKFEAAIPGAADFIQKFESSPGASQGGLGALFAGLAGKLLGARAEEFDQVAGVVLQARLQARAARSLFAEGDRVDQVAAPAGAPGEAIGQRAGPREAGRVSSRAGSLNPASMRSAHEFRHGLTDCHSAAPARSRLARDETGRPRCARQSWTVAFHGPFGLTWV